MKRNKAVKTLWWQKILLCFLGILVTFCLLEIGLRVGGAVSFFLQDQNNKVSFSTKEQYRIMCIGESTTNLAGKWAYPWLLEEELNARQSERTFEVFNRGITAITSDYILNHLNENIEKYKPDMVIAMIGVNDVSLKDPSFIKWLKNFRTFKLIFLLSKHVKSKFFDKAKNLSSESHEKNKREEKLERFPNEFTSEDLLNLKDDISEKQCLVFIKEIQSDMSLIAQMQSLAKNQTDPSSKNQIIQKIKFLYERLLWKHIFVSKYFIQIKDYPKAEFFLKEALSLNPKFLEANIQLANLYRDISSYSSAKDYYRKVIALDSQQPYGYMGLGDVLFLTGHFDEAFKMYSFLFDKEINEVGYYSELAQKFIKKGRLEYAVQILSEAIKAHPGSYYLYVQLAETYRQLGETERYQEYFKKAQKLKSNKNTYYPATIYNYNRIAEEVLQRGITLIAMQYPLRDVQPLKDILKNRSNIIFVENKDNFEKNLKVRERSYYFSDWFAGDFGHCTREGNLLIVHNLADVILKELSKK